LRGIVTIIWWDSWLGVGYGLREAKLE
jgi:hypothetical protein